MRLPYFDVVKTPTAPAHVQKRAQLATDEIDVAFDGLTHVISDAHHDIPSEWVVCGQWGARMHEDRHMPRYSILLVCHGDPYWNLASVWRGEVVWRDAGAGRAFLLDTHAPHSLHHRKNQHKDGWIALAWTRQSRRGALGVWERLRSFYEESGWLKGDDHD